MYNKLITKAKNAETSRILNENIKNGKTTWEIINEITNRAKLRETT